MTVEDHAGSGAHPIDRARAALQQEPLVAVDLALAALGSTRSHRSDVETSEYLDLLARAVIAQSSCAAPEDEDPVVAMLSDRGCDSLACAALLRLLVLDDDPFLSDPRLLAAAGLFDRVLAGRLYQTLGLSPKHQAFEKRDQLRTAVADHESALFGHVDALASLDTLQAFGQQLTTLFKDQLTQMVVKPFLPDGTVAQTLTEVVGAARAASEAEDVELLKDAEASATQCRELRESAAAVGTTYATLLLTNLADRLDELVRQHVRARGLADPAKLVVRVREKRYPLAYPGSNLVLRVDLFNEGPGQARDVTLELEGHQAVEFEDTVRGLGFFGVGERLVELPGQVTEPVGEDAVLLRVAWRNPDGSPGEAEELVMLKGQSSEIPWAELELAPDAYPLDPVTDMTRFVGREAVLRDLAKVILSGGNARIEGQRRVGKTSVALALARRLEEAGKGEYSFLYIESGDYGANTASDTVRRLGEIIADGVKSADPRLAGLSIPSFEVGLSPLTDVFRQADTLAPDRRFVVVLDEFDAVPHPELYRHEPLGDALFQTLRSLGGKPNVGFVLVGGERMRWVIATHGQALNKFRLVPVDYFGPDQFDDYRRLVCDPVREWFTIEDAAVRELYAASAGNPWITKLIAAEMFDRQVAGRDADVRADDVRAAIESALPKLGAPSFQHFWDDAIRGDAEDQEHVSVSRRKVLLGLAMCIREGAALTEEAIAKASRRFDLDEFGARDVLRDFIERKILVPDETGDELRCRVPLFERWLPDHGVSDIVVTMDDDSLMRQQRLHEAARPTQAELEELVKKWRTYNGELLTVERVRAWLNQFVQAKDQRVMFQLLQGLRYYGSPEVAESLRQLHEFVRRELGAAGREVIRTGQQRMRSDLLVCGLEGGGSGASHLVAPYRMEASIYKDCAVDSGKVPAALQEATKPINAVLILEDFVASGETAKTQLARLYTEWTADRPWPKDVAVYLIVVCGFDEALDRVARAIERLDWPARVFAADVLDRHHRCFDEDSVVFPDIADRERALALCMERGAQLSPRHPLGYEDSQAAVCFETRCPNNTLPILWKDTPNWRALFPRF